ncbi:MAG TPA: RIO1 family regulatory kinase/ATPase [Anaerolineales bacterium]|nr:RIO1 family regulatory kinase/ATPase [Anaerolineales bacterium]
MPSKNEFDEINTELADIPFQRIRNAGPAHSKAGLRNRKPAQTIQDSPLPLTSDGEDDSLEAALLTYNPSRHERVWILDSLSDFYDQQWFGDILRQVKGGKEASVYQCVAKTAIQAPFLAAKVYRPRRFRNLKKDHLYREGREYLDENGNAIRNHGMLHAIQKKTAWGKELTHTAWIEYEYRTLQILHQAGADVPVPYTRGNNAILMSYIGGEDQPAPTLQEVHLSRAEARQVYHRALYNVELMLDHNLIHGDLSAFNILYWQEQITLIDFPQVVDPDQNVNAYWIFERDITRLCEYFSPYGIKSNAPRLAASLWRNRGWRIEHPVDPAYLDADRPEDRRYWNHENSGAQH